SSASSLLHRLFCCALLQNTLEFFGLEEADQNDHKGLVYRQLLRGDAQRVQRGGHRLDGDGADDGAADVEFAAAEKRSAQGHGQDGVHLHVEAGVVGVRRRDHGGFHQSGNAGADAGEDVHHKDDGGDLEARAPGGVGIDAHRLDEQSHRRLFLDQNHKQHHEGGNEDGGRQGAAGNGGADVGEGLIVHGDILPLGNQHGDASSGGQQDQCGHHGLDLQLGDQEAVPHAAQGADQHGDQTGRQQRHIGGAVPCSADQGAADGAGDGDDRTLGDVDAPGGDDEGHAHRQDHQDRSPVEN
ncbi:putative Fe-S center protein, partial [Dysosmobacter welbionis]